MLSTEPRLMRRPAASWRRPIAALSVIAVTLGASDARAEEGDTANETVFNSDFLHGSNGQTVDLAHFSRAAAVAPGDYLVDLDVNGQWRDRIPVRVARLSGSSDSGVCVDRALMTRIGLNFDALPASVRDHIGRREAGACQDLAALVRGAKLTFDISRLHLSVDVPQAVLSRRPRGYVASELWDEGIPSATLAYDGNAFHARREGHNSTSLFLGLTSGINVGSWHLRHRSTVNAMDGHWRYQNIATYLVHDIPTIKSRLVIGDAFTDGAVFDSFGFRGVLLASDDRMRPESQRGYAPVVRGIARTNARVRVEQDSAILLETTVPAGAFEIDDLYPTGYGGDLKVSVLEADGSQQNFTVTYASLAQLLRPGVMRYAIAGGEYRQGGSAAKLRFVQGTVQYGLNNFLTGYAGTQVADHYFAGQLGLAVNTPLGALSLDTTYARSAFPTSARHDGYSIRASYSKIVPGVGTNIAVAAYRYSSSGFWSLQDMAQARSTSAGDLQTYVTQRQRERIQINLSQDLGGERGSFYLAGARTGYWGGEAGSYNIQAGYNNYLRLRDVNVSYGLSYVHQKFESSGTAENRMMLTLSLSLGNKIQSPHVTAGLIRHDRGGSATLSSQVGLSGVLGRDNEFGYHVYGDASADTEAVGISTSYRAPFATLAGGASTGRGFTQFSLGASGGMVLHAGGLTLANRLTDTIGLLEARGAKGARVAGGIGTRVDGGGHAVLPYLVPYHMNQVSLDPEGMPLDVELGATRQQVAPRADSVVLVRFATISGQAVLFNVRQPSGSVVPFGANVIDSSKTEVGLVGQNGQLFLRGIPSEGQLLIKWDDAKGKQCGFDYRLPKRGSDRAPLLQIDAICQSGDTASSQPDEAKVIANARVRPGGEQ